MEKVSVIVPAFNEEKNIAKVLKALLGSSCVDEVICISDGSTDRTAEIIEGFGEKIKFLDFKKNHGKGFALAQGLKIATREVVLFFDGDIVNLKEEYILQLAEPLLKKSDLLAVIGAPYRYRASLYFPFNIYLSGQRAYRKAILLPHLDELQKVRFGAEVYLNSLVSDDKTKIVYLKGFHSLTKYEKRDLDKATKEFLKGAFEVAYQKSKIVFKPYVNYYRAEFAPRLNQELKWEEYKERLKDLKRFKNLLK